MTTQHKDPRAVIEMLVRSLSIAILDMQNVA